MGFLDWVSILIVAALLVLAIHVYRKSGSCVCGASGCAGCVDCTAAKTCAAGKSCASGKTYATGKSCASGKNCMAAKNCTSGKSAGFREADREASPDHEAMQGNIE